MRFTHFWAAIALSSPLTFAQSTTTSSASPTTTSAEPRCTASLITKICDYKSPGPEFAIASDSREFCLEKCNEDTPCDFVIFYPHNPFLGDGTCWLYPGEKYDPSAAKTDCEFLEVYDKPACKPTSTTPDVCAATASPSAVASVCGYPTPPGDCWDDCTASSSATNCLSQCAEAESCNYVVFNPHNPSNTPWAGGSCWLYANGTYDASAASTCSGAPEQYVYNNPCPKPQPPHSGTSSSSSSPSSPTSTLHSPYSPSPYSPNPYATSTAASSPTSLPATSSASRLSHSSSVSSVAPSASAIKGGSGAVGVTTYTGTSSKNLVPTLAIGMTLLIWLGL